MIRNLKVLGLALIAIFAMGAMTAGAASAANTQDSLVSEESPLDLTGAGTNNVFTAGKAKVTCSAAFSGTVKNKEENNVTVHPVYGEEKETCEVSPFGKGTVTTKGCNYILEGLTTENTTTKTLEDAAVEVECETGKNIVIDGPGCTITVKPQTIKNAISFKNEGSGKTRDVLITATATTIAFTSTGSLCGIGGVPASGEGSYTGTVTAKGYKDGSKHEASDQRGIEIKI